jgi:hypothetical protein
VSLPSGDRLVVFHRPGSRNSLVHIFHGLSGDANSDYVRHAAQVASDMGYGVLAVNHRGSGAGRGLAKGVYHSGCAADLAEVFAWSSQHFGKRPLGIGFSLSGNALLLLLARGGKCLPAGAIAINPPICLKHCSERISRGWNRIYEARFVRRITRAMKERQRSGLLPSGFHPPPSRSLREIDEHLTAPLAGFRDADDYYARCSTHEMLGSIQQPTVILTAADDPFVAVADFEELDLPASVHLHIEDTGGHVGYLARGANALSCERWLAGALRHYLGELEVAGGLTA